MPLPQQGLDQPTEGNFDDSPLATPQHGADQHDAQEQQQQAAPASPDPQQAAAGDIEPEAPYEDLPVEEFKHRPMVSTKPLYDFRKVFQRLPQLAKDKPDTAVRLLLGLHEKYWHSPPGDLKNLLARVGMPVEVLNLVSDAVMKCQICRRYVRLPNRPQTKVHNAGNFNQVIQADLFKLFGTWILLMVDEATRYKVAVSTLGRDAQELQQKFLESWMRYFGPPGALTMDQEASLMSHEVAAEFERLGIERKPKGTTAGAAGAQHTGTGLIERHAGLMKLTMLKLKAELDRQGIVAEPNEIAMEAAMAQNCTLNYNGVTPAMAVFGVLPRGFYDDESPGVLAAAGALQTDLTVFEKALRIRQMSLAAVQQAIVEDRTARANRTRSHRLDTTSLIAGTSEVEFYREVQGDAGWRGPALLLRIDPDEGIAIIQYQGRPYLVSIRHIRHHVQTFLGELNSMKLPDKAEDELYDIMKNTEMVPPTCKRLLGHVPDQKATGVIWRQVPTDNFDGKMFDKAKAVSLALTNRPPLSGIIYGKSLKFIKPPKDTTGHLITWSLGSMKYHIQEHWSSDPIKLKKVTMEKLEEICSIYLFYHVFQNEEITNREWKHSQPMDSEQQQQQLSDPQAPGDQPQPMDADDTDCSEQHGQKRDGPDSRTVVIAPEKKKMRTEYWSSHSVYYKASSLHYLLDRRRRIKTDAPTSWTGTQLWADNTLTEQFFQEQQQHTAVKGRGEYLFHIGSSKNALLHVDLRTSDVWKVDTEHDDITEDDVYKIWPQVDAADRTEVEQFVQEQAFKKIHKDAFTDDMVVIDARWVRKWKKLPHGQRKVKSRLCARGCLDRQKDLLTTRSTTATRLSQRLLLSTAAVFDLSVESCDIAGAFLKGLNFHQIREMLRKMGINSPVRTVVVIPPLNTWRHLAACSSDFAVRDPEQWGLLCLKPVYGLNDAPLAWQLCLQQYLREIKGVPSAMDENSWRWKRDDGSILALCTCHVDDMAIAAPQQWLDEHYQAFVNKFKKVTRQILPFEHCGAKYEKIPDGYRMIQDDFCEKMTAANIPNDRKDNDKLTKEETTSYRSILGALLWLTATRLDLVAEVSHLATHVTTAEIRHLRYANQVLKRAQDKDSRGVGLYFRKLNPKHGLRLACFHDASSHTKEKAYAHEGVLVLLMEDHVKPQSEIYEHSCADDEARLHGGRAHILWSHGSKAKRISYSTSHAETLAAINGHESAILVSIRLSEMLHKDKTPSLQQLAALQEAGNMQLPIDDYGDCNDVFQLVTGCKTLPQDKSQRIYVLSLRESRLSGRIRWMALIPTQSVIADCLTKPMISKQMMMLLTTGELNIVNEEKHHVQMKRLPPKYDIEERDLEMNDQVLIDEFHKVKCEPKNLWWTPMMAAVKKGMFPFAVLLTLSSLPIVHAETGEQKSQDSFLFYMLVIFTLMILVVERIVWHFGRKIRDFLRDCFSEATSETDVTISQQSSLSQHSSMASSSLSAMATLHDAAIQTDQAKRLLPEPNPVTKDEEIKRLETKIHQLEYEAENYKADLWRLRQQTSSLIRLGNENRDLKAQNDILKNRVKAMDAPKLTSEHVPEHLYVMAHGGCFHCEACSCVANPNTRPVKLAKCKKCF